MSTRAVALAQHGSERTGPFPGGPLAPVPDRTWRALTGAGLERFHGHISGAGTPDGHAVVCDAWHASPLGPFAEVMWIAPDGHRTLLAPSNAVAAESTGLYAFDEVRIVDVRGRVDATSVSVQAGPGAGEAASGAAPRPPPPR